jgi:hypothetical protein
MPCPQGMPGILLRDGRRLRHGHTFVDQGADYGAFHDEGDRPGAPGSPHAARRAGRSAANPVLGPAELERAGPAANVIIASDNPYSRKQHKAVGR